VFAAPPFAVSFVAGFLASLALIVAIGAQNAFVLRQGLRGEHLLPVALICAFSDALLIAILLSSIQVGVQLLTRWQGDAGMLVGALLAALADVHASTAALLGQGGPDSSSGQAIAQGLMAALLVHAGSKSAVALASGGWRYALAVAPGIVAHTLAFVGVMAVLA